jgi:hypothetical protein
VILSLCFHIHTRTDCPCAKRTLVQRVSGNSVSAVLTASLHMQLPPPSPLQSSSNLSSSFSRISLQPVTRLHEPSLLLVRHPVAVLCHVACHSHAPPASCVHQVQPAHLYIRCTVCQRRWCSAPGITSQSHVTSCYPLALHRHLNEYVAFLKRVQPASMHHDTNELENLQLATRTAYLKKMQQEEGCDTAVTFHKPC